MRSTLVDLSRIDTVLLDLDGTLLDLAYDNYIWLERIPREWALRTGVTHEAALHALVPRFRAVEGTFDGYEIDFWARELGIDSARVHRE